MKLSFRKLGQGKPLFILHGLFGSSDNWQTLGRQFARPNDSSGRTENFTVYLIDQRNHGRSPHSPDHNYEVMSEDLLELMKDEKLDKIMLLGHSMGGKIAMHFAVRHPEKVEKMVVVDMSPKEYPMANQDIIDALEKINMYEMKSRKQLEELLSSNIRDMATLQFLLKNLYWDDRQRLTWRFNLEAIKNNLVLMGEQTPAPPAPLKMPVLFVKGEKSDHVVNADVPLINAMFSNVRIVTIPGAGHWVHADKPAGFFNIVNTFLSEN